MFEILFDYVGKNDDEQYVYSKFISKLLNEEKCREKILENILRKKPSWKFLSEPTYNIETIASSEYEIEERFIDILLTYASSEGEKNYIIFELKIHAEDQQNQLADYYDSIFNKYGKHPFIVYLTLDGHVPTEKSLSYQHELRGNGQLLSTDYLSILPDFSMIQSLTQDKYILFIYEDFIRQLRRLQVDSDLKEGKNISQHRQTISSFFNKLHETDDSLCLFVNGGNLREKIQDDEAIQIGRFFDNKSYGLFFEFSKNEDSEWFLYYGVASPSKYKALKNIKLSQYYAYISTIKDKTIYTRDMDNHFQNLCHSHHRINRDYWLFAQDVTWLMAEDMLSGEITNAVLDFFNKDFKKISKS